MLDLSYPFAKFPKEVIFEEARAHLGVATQRQWADKAIERTTPVLLGLFSLITLLAHCLGQEGCLPVAQAAWYEKSAPTFSDAIALVRRHIWQACYFVQSAKNPDFMLFPREVVELLLDRLCYAA